jgi:hypothetical protein
MRLRTGGAIPSLSIRLHALVLNNAKGNFSAYLKTDHGGLIPCLFQFPVQIRFIVPGCLLTQLKMRL